MSKTLSPHWFYSWFSSSMESEIPLSGKSRLISDAHPTPLEFEYATECGQEPSVASAALLELLHSPSCLVNADGSVTHLNVAWRRHVGIMDGGCDFISWVQLIYAEDRYAALSHFQRAIAMRERMDFECRLQDCRGEAHWFLLSLQPLGGMQSDQSGLLCLATDIDRLKRKELDLERRASVQTDMLNISVDCIKLISPDGTLLHMNRAGCDALGVPENSLFGMPWLALLPEDVRVAGEKAIASARAGTFARFPGRSVLPEGEVQYWDNMLTPIMNGGAAPTAILCVSREVTAEREALETLQANEERLAIAVAVGGLGIWDYDIRRDELHCDEAWYRIMGRDPSCPIRSIAEFRSFIHPDDVDRATEVERTAGDLTASKRDYAIVFRIIHPNGDIRWVRSAAYLQHVSGAPTRAVGFVVDITDVWHRELALRDANRVLEEEKTVLVRQSIEDPLTGIANRRGLDRELARICSEPDFKEEAICIGMIDVDHFKAYNDRYGHLAGDAALRNIASALQSVARQSDTVARYGGEEFAFIMMGVRDPVPILDRFIAIVAELAIVHADSPTGHLTISCGCVVFTSLDKLSPALLLKRSDELLYEAKAAGRNCHVVRVNSA
ncbi:diguanylate cyclase [Rhizobium sp. BK602]|uniref:sensor domain-containing diguanylate cyclase n=1 Tax=Rhizobium sp. BK602 TaxID=2586986 RepID=UPI001617CA0F|nr:diguanylate cyclase [Rhizobium sp. BK602]MBB3612373.1 diguanylate cyclase (GGDEF)-like protein [Rhizobium sp. BK602]